MGIEKNIAITFTGPVAVSKTSSDDVSGCGFSSELSSGSS